MDEFFAHRAADMAERVRALENWAANVSLRTQSRATGLSTLGSAGQAAAAAASGGGGGGGSLSGDVTGIPGNNAVSKLQGQSLLLGATALGQLIEWDGTEWANTQSLHGTLTLDEGVNLALGTVTGAQLGTAANQKLGLWGATPVVQRPGTTDLRQVAIDIGALAAGGATPLDLNGGALTTAAAVHSVTDAGTSTEPTLLTVAHRSSGTPGASFGTTTLFQADNSTNTLTNQLKVAAGWSSATAGAENSLIIWSVRRAGVDTEVLRLNAVGNGRLQASADFFHFGTNFGIFGKTPTTQPAAYTITNATPNRSLDEAAATLTQVSQVLGTLVTDLKSLGIVG